MFRLFFSIIIAAFILLTTCICLRDEIRDETSFEGVFWTKFSKHKPKKSNWYLCTIREQMKDTIMLLYWDGNHFVNMSRNSVFNTYVVLKKEEWDDSIQTQAIMPDEETLNRIYSDDLCNLTSKVVFWKNKPDLPRRSRSVYRGDIEN